MPSFLCKSFLSSIGIFLSFLLSAQTTLAPSARFSFDDKKEVDLISQQKIDLSNTTFSHDRFGNDNHALLLSGKTKNDICLGTYSALKPQQGTIVLWIKIESIAANGNTDTLLPLLMCRGSASSKRSPSYLIAYSPEQNRIMACCSKDTLHHIEISSVQNFSEKEWHHVALAYDNTTCLFYVDGLLETREQKNFETVFNLKDSVLLINSPFLNTAVDDIAFYDQVLNPEEIKTLYHAPNPKQLLILVWFGKGTLVLVLIILLFLLVRKLKSRRLV